MAMEECHKEQGGKKMYCLLKQNTFFLETKNNGLFMKNNIGNIYIGTPKSYTLFTALLPYLDGKNNIEELFQKINNEKLKKFYQKLLMILKERKFILFSDTLIDLSKYGDFEKSAMYYCDSLDSLSRINNIAVASTITIRSKNSEINRTFSSILSYFDTINKQTNKNDYITIDVFCNNKTTQVYVFKPQNVDKIIISENEPVPEELDPDFFSIPLHIFEIIACILEIEIKLKITGIQKENFFGEDYIFDLRLLSGKPMVKEESTNA